LGKIVKNKFEIKNSQTVKKRGVKRSENEILNEKKAENPLSNEG
jgi:hypothetical protein